LYNIDIGTSSENPSQITVHSGDSTNFADNDTHQPTPITSQDSSLGANTQNPLQADFRIRGLPLPEKKIGKSNK